MIFDNIMESTVYDTSLPKELETVAECSGNPFQYAVSIIYENQMMCNILEQEILIEGYNYLLETGEVIHEDNIISKFFQGILSIVKKIWGKICAFFKKIFGIFKGNAKTDADFVATHAKIEPPKSIPVPKTEQDTKKLEKEVEKKIGDTSLSTRSNGSLSSSDSGDDEPVDVSNRGQGNHTPEHPRTKNIERSKNLSLEKKKPVKNKMKPKTPKVPKVPDLWGWDYTGLERTQFGCTTIDNLDDYQEKLRDLSIYNNCNSLEDIKNKSNEVLKEIPIKIVGKNYDSSKSLDEQLTVHYKGGRKQYSVDDKKFLLDVIGATQKSMQILKKTFDRVKKYFGETKKYLEEMEKKCTTATGVDQNKYKEGASLIPSLLNILTTVNSVSSKGILNKTGQAKSLVEKIDKYYEQLKKVEKALK